MSLHNLLTLQKDASGIRCRAADQSTVAMPSWMSPLIKGALDFGRAASRTASDVLPQPQLLIVASSCQNLPVFRTIRRDPAYGLTINASVMRNAKM